ncbi:hypothetical protein PR001_g25310 [Phytophthora rubi]|uniref:Uncharacterized protein n=1 Tax=Phytophthora rubi TaxID=129364 RepID=A0A6A3LDR0_9STRA|nr:hypothetical protein PR001_g25310 [Phytophthora rubi]KAE9013993.1 hypothetical protein PR002_g14352 [Phytophthora rubi]
MTLVTTPEDFPCWTNVKPTRRSNQYVYAPLLGGVFISWKQIECGRVLAPDIREMDVVEEYGDFDQDMELVPSPTLLR